MKKNILILVLVLLIPILAGCGVSRPQNISYYYVGTLRTSGSYYTISTDTDTFRIKSTFLDLSSYIDKKVKIHGQFSQDLFYVDDIKPAT